MFPILKIGKLMPKFPVIQGGMAVKVSTSSLASAVAEAGGIGIIGASGMKADEVAFEISKSKELSKGIIGINIMVAVSNFLDVVKAAIAEKVDLIIAGAGFSKDLFKMGRDNGVEIVPVVSSLKVAALSQRLGASAVVVEGKDAGGHLGTNLSVREIFPEIKKELGIPVVAAGGLTTGQDIAEMFIMGADGVQLGSRFLMSEECDISPIFKEICLKAKEEDMVLIQSPVGLKASAIKTSFVEKILAEDPEIRTKTCNACLKHCSHSFCILKALVSAREGDTENGLFFAGHDICKINDILPVKEIIERLLSQAHEIIEKHFNPLKKTVSAAL